MKILNTRRYTKDNDLNIFGDYKALQMRSTWKSKAGPNGMRYRCTSRSFWLISKKGRDRRLTKPEIGTALYNFFLQQKGIRRSIL